MNLIRLLFKIPLVIAAALAGNQVGYLVREQYLGQDSHQLRFYQKGADDEVTIAINPIMTNFLPAVALGLLSKPGWLISFLSGVAIAAALGDEYESQFWEMIGIESSIDSPTDPIA